MNNDINEYINYLEYERRLARNTCISYEKDLNDYILFLKQKNINSVNDIVKKVIKEYDDYNYDEIYTIFVIIKKTRYKNNFNCKKINFY